ncbi:hypothetical protein HYZ97_03600 [Candidatus Pacearchaeota archaeon]|nr:hypothetical protein [Candidatus Pacearchaeota archaeon]
MEFKPLYYVQKERRLLPGDDFNKENINVINPHGTAGIITLWSKPWDIWNTLRNRFPALFTAESPLVTLTSLYGNGLPQMLANLAHNPQIQYLAVTGNDVKAAPSFTYLMNFLQQGVEVPANPGQLGRIKGTEYPLDPQLHPGLFTRLQIKRFGPNELEGLVKFVQQAPIHQVTEQDRVPVTLVEPEFKDFPSDIMNHNLVAKTPLQAWMEMIYTIDRFGINVQLEKGQRRALYNLDVTILNPAIESREQLAQFGFDVDKLEGHRQSVLDGKLPEGLAYTYGNRIREHFGVDSLDLIVQRFKEDPVDRRGFMTTWDNSTDIISPSQSDSSVPCLTDLYLFNHDEKLNLTASFRTHSAVSGWFMNLYGLRGIQEYVAQRIGIEPGRINIRSRWIGIDPNDAKTNAALDTVKRYRKVKIDVNDPRGYLVLTSEGHDIIAEHYAPDGKKLRTYRGASALEIKDQLRQDATIIDSDHALWIGMQLGALHYKLHNQIPE